MNIITASCLKKYMRIAICNESTKRYQFYIVWQVRKGPKNITITLFDGKIIKLVPIASVIVSQPIQGYN